MLSDRVHALAPFDAAEARELINSLALRGLLEGKRGRPPADIERLSEALARFSVMVADLGDLIAETDVNPLLAGPDGPIALDALVIPTTVGVS
jgi:acetate---CoA ligase (ADP-forming)